MSEEEIKILKVLINNKDIFYYEDDFNNRIRPLVGKLLDLYNQTQKQLNNLKEIEKTHKEENGKLRVELEQYKRLAEMNLKDAEEFQNNMCEHRCILYNEIEELKAGLFEEKEKNKELEAKQIWNKGRIEELKNELVQEKEKNNELEIELSTRDNINVDKLVEKYRYYRRLADSYQANCISKDKLKDMMKYREFELQQQYKDFEEDAEWKTYKKILEEK